MKVLVLGGTRFIGRHLVTACLDRGDDVTVAHRGTSPSPFAGTARHVITDRRALSSDAAKVLAESWDAVLDTSAQDPEDLRLVPAMLGDIGRYLLLSTCGVYRRTLGQQVVLTERSPTIFTETADPVRAPAIRKLHCERFLRRRLDRARIPWIIARLGLVVGTFDTSQRLAYWLERSLRGGDALVPMNPAQPLRIVDAHDVTRFLLHAIDGPSGVINVAGPPSTAGELIDTVVRCAGTSLTPHWVAEEFALDSGLRPWTEIPLWLPATSPERALMAVSSSRARALGLTYRPLGDTIANCLTWQAMQRYWSPQWLTLTQEQILLRQWRR